MEAVRVPTQTREAPAATPDWWPQLEALVERAPRPSDVLAHRLHLIAAARWTAAGRPLPGELAQEALADAVVALGAPVLVARIRSALDGPIVLLKGPEVAALYPDPSLRAFRDVDLLVPEPRSAWRELRRSGFLPTGDPRLYEGIHHLRPLYLPGFPIVVELHAQPKWIAWSDAPSWEVLHASAVPSAIGVDGVLTLAPAHHAVALAVHSWAHEPLRRVCEILDVGLLCEVCGREEPRAFAESLGVGRLWSCTIGAFDAMLDRRRRGIAVRVWGRNLVAVRERSVIESHLEHWLGPFSALPARRASMHAARALARDLRRGPHETWGPKLARSARAIRNAFTRRSDHDRELAEATDHDKGGQR